jgi:hypothetical protein
VMNQFENDEHLIKNPNHYNNKRLFSFCHSFFLGNY